MSSGLCSCPLKTIRENDGDGDGGGDRRARGVIVVDYHGEVADVKDVSVADFVRGRDHSEGVHFVAWEARLETRSRN